VNDHVIEVALGLLLQPRQGLGVDVAEVAEDRQPRGPRDVVGGRIGPEPEELRPAQIAANPVNWFKTKIVILEVNVKQGMNTITIFEVKGRLFSCYEFIKALILVHDWKYCTKLQLYQDSYRYKYIYKNGYFMAVAVTMAVCGCGC
jgi:hypothetical protein